MANNKIWVEKSRYYRTVQRAKELENSARRSQWQQRLSEQTNRRLQAELDQKLAARDQTTQQVQQQIRQISQILQGENQALLSQMQQSLQEQSQQTQQQMDALYGDLAALSQQAEALDGKIEDLSNEVAQRFREMAEAVAQERLRAEIYVNYFTQSLAQIRQLHPEKLTPGQVEQDLDPVEDFLRADMLNGDYQAAMGLAQTKLPEAAALQIRLELLNREFEALQIENQEAIRLLTQRTEALLNPQENICQLSIDGSFYEYDGETMFWSDGVLQDALGNFEAAKQGYRSAESRMDLAQMRQSLEFFSQINLHLEECEFLAHEQFRLYGMIGALAGRICDSLSRDESWHLLSDRFSGDDPRRSFEMAYGDGDGDTATFVLFPNRELSPQDQPGEVQFVVDVAGPSLPQDQTRCSLIRRSLLSRLTQDRIDIGAHNRSPEHTVSPDQKTFLAEATAQSDRIKDDRLAAVREQLQLHSQIQE